MSEMRIDRAMERIAELERVLQLVQDYDVMAAHDFCSKYKCADEMSMAIKQSEIFSALSKSGK